MKKSLIKYVVFCGIVSVISCQKQPSACIEAEKIIATVNESISFSSSCSKNTHHCEWAFGDGKTSTEQNPTHAYSVAGTYKVSFMNMSKNDKKMDQTSKTITIN